MLGIAGVILVAALLGAGFLVARGAGLLGRQDQVVASNPVGSDSDDFGSPDSQAAESSETAPSASETSPPPTGSGKATGFETPSTAQVAPAGVVLNLKDKPKNAAQAALRQELLDKARTYFSTNSRFFVNQIWVDGDVAIGEIGAEHRGHRIWVVWRGSPWHVVWSGNWGVTDESVLADKVGALPPELLDKIDWTRPWPKAFKFIP